MKKLVQLKDKNNNNYDPINSNYQNRLLKLEGTVLYEGHTTEIVNLSDDINNYSEIEVIGRNADVGYVSSGKLPAINNMLINLVGTSFRENDVTLLCFWTSTLLVSGKTLIPQSSKYAYLVNNGSAIVDGNYMGVVKVIGYK